MKATDPISVSIIIYNYNYARDLEQAIQSARGQTYKPIEIIVVDDGSTDESRSILARQPEDVTVVLRENGGQAAAFNSGLAKSTGRLVAFLDSDDMLTPHAIATVVERWSDDFSKMQFPLEIVDMERAATGLRMPRLPVSAGNVIGTFLQTGRYISSPTSGNVFNRRFLEQVMPIPEPEWAKTADGYLNNCAPFFGTIGAIPTPLGYYRVHGQSVSSVISKGVLNVPIARQLMANGLNEKALIAGLAAERGYTVNPDIVTSHWMFLKLRLTLERVQLRGSNAGSSVKTVLKAGWDMVLSAVRSPELKPVKKLQHVGVGVQRGSLAVASGATRRPGRV